MTENSRSKVLITGATSGIGRAAAVQLARDGFEVLVHGRDAERGRATVAAVAAFGGRARFVAAELTDLGALRELAAQASDVDVLVNNSGFGWFGPSSELPPERFDALFAANVRAPYYLVSALAPKMIERGHGNIINVSSVVATTGIAGGAAYSATKGALEALTRAWAAELSPRGVRVNAIAPGPVYTAVAKRERIAALGQQTLLGRAANDDEIAHAIAFLASARASYITGAVLAADGGRGAI